MQNFWTWIGHYIDHCILVILFRTRFKNYYRCWQMINGIISAAQKYPIFLQYVEYLKFLHDICDCETFLVLADI